MQGQGVNAYVNAQKEKRKLESPNLSEMRCDARVMIEIM